MADGVHRPQHLATGHFGSEHWYASVNGARAKDGTSLPCAILVLRNSSGSGNPETEFEGSDSVCRDLDPRSAPTVLAQEISADDGRVHREVILILAAQDVRTVEIVGFGSGPDWRR
jgi:hypothetical protein